MQLLKNYCDEYAIDHRTDVSLADYCTFRIGGGAPLLIRPKSEREIAGVLAVAAREDIPLLVLGKGSNILFADAGYPGAVLLLDASFGRISLSGEDTVVCESGAALSRLCAFALEHGLSGLEFAYGIPGTVGGAVYMNAGAYGGEVKDVILSASHLNRRGGRGGYCAGELALSYRNSVYAGTDEVITGAAFRLHKDDPAAIKARMDDYMGQRRARQPLEYPSAGSTFKRPEGAYAAALIDGCGLKGRRIGGAMVSEKHAGFLINYDKATAADVSALVTLVRDEVEARTGYRLECEIKRIGF